jgi:mRNA interferase RelE/StbE
MKLIFSKSAIKFLNKISEKDNKRVKSKIFDLLDLAASSDSIKFGELNTKSLKGDLQGFSRMRVGKIRVVFTVDLQQKELLIHDIDFRGDIY